jgi:hypothetical protein
VFPARKRQDPTSLGVSFPIMGCSGTWILQRSIPPRPHANHTNGDSGKKKFYGTRIDKLQRALPTSVHSFRYTCGNNELRAPVCIKTCMRLVLGVLQVNNPCLQLAQRLRFPHERCLLSQASPHSPSISTQSVRTCHDA